MTTKTKIITGIVIVATAFAFGRYSAPERVRTEVKTVEVEKKTETKESNTNRHKETTTVTITKPDGSTETTTKTTEDTNLKTDSKLVDDTTKSSDTTKEVTRGGNKLSIAALSGINYSKPDQLIYGASVSKELIGPITLGAFGLTDKTVGISIGLNF